MRYAFMLAKGGEKDAGDPVLPQNALLELKYDGVRVIWDGPSGRMYSRRDIAQNARFPDIVPFLPTDVVLDGEIVVLDTTTRSVFGALARRGTFEIANRLAAKVEPATFIVFDILEADGKDLRGLPFHERRRILRERVPQVGRVPGETVVISWNPPPILVWPKSWPGEEFKAAKAWVIENGEEGLIVKDLDRRYEADGKEKRTDAWVKWKPWKYGVFDVVRWGVHRDLHPGHDGAEHDTTVAIIENGGREQCVAISEARDIEKLAAGSRALIVRYKEVTDSGALVFGTSRGVHSSRASAEGYIKLRLE